MSLDRLRAMPGHLIRRAQQISSGFFIEELRGTDLTPVQFAALTAIREHPGIVATDLSGLIAFDRATIGGVIERLEGRGFIRREQRASDKRIKRLFATPAGERQLDSLWNALEGVQLRLLACLSTDERDVFMELLKRIVETHNPTAPNVVRGDEPVIPRRKSAGTGS